VSHTIRQRRWRESPWLRLRLVHNVNVLFECQATEPARARHRDALGLDACDMRCLMDKVYQLKDADLVMDFVYEASNYLTPGPTA
jgi:hypothetical protein